MMQQNRRCHGCACPSSQLRHLLTFGTARTMPQERLEEVYHKLCTVLTELAEAAQDVDAENAQQVGATAVRLCPKAFHACCRACIGMPTAATCTRPAKNTEAAQCTQSHP